MLIRMAEAGLIPDTLLRWGMRRMDAALQRKLSQISDNQLASLIDSLHAGPMVIGSDEANLQHYELPPEFFKQFMGEQMKYSCCYWPEGTTTLGEAEAASLELMIERAGIEDGMSVLELGCGWGSFSLYVAEKFANSSVHGVSNSSDQRKYILAEAKRRGVNNLTIQTANIAELNIGNQFDRVVSIEMFEHVRNWKLLLERIKSWLKPGGRIFCHFFVHRDRAYTFEAAKGDWMARHFFTGGLMPCPHYLHSSLPAGLILQQDWQVNGTHYAKTLNAWLENYDSRKSTILPILEKVYGRDAPVWWHRWRMFFLGCAEFFAFDDGNEWFVYHATIAG